MANAGANELLTPEIFAAIETIKAHRAVVSLEIAGNHEAVVCVVAHFSVNLPSRAAAAGHSENGVRETEEVFIFFPKNFPVSAPQFKLRADFPTNLPHIYRHAPGDLVPPCITVGDQRDVLHEEGIYRLVVQLSDWLDKAAVGQLTNNEQGWEPSRRDAKYNFLEIESDSFVPANPPWGGWRMYACPTISTDDGERSRTSKGQRIAAALSRGWLERLLAAQTRWEFGHKGVASLVVCWPSQDGVDGARIDDTYKADTVQTFAQMAERALELRCRVALDDFLSNFNRVAKSSDSRGTLPIIFVFPIRRPLNVMGQYTPYELLAYRVELPMPGQLEVTSEEPVTQIAFWTPLGPALLRRTSGLADLPHKAKFAFIGCGSLGSKVVMHVARAGLQPSLLIDGKIMVPHNTARHALLPLDADAQCGKADRLASIVRTFGVGAPDTLGNDLRKLDFADKRYRTNFESEGAFVVNTTGSAAVRHYLTRGQFSARVVEAALVNRGTGAYLTIEGAGRSPSTTDLMYHGYEQMRWAGLLASIESRENHILDVGVGCHSVTIAMSDATVSLVAGGVGQKLLRIDSDGAPDAGIVAIATVGDDGMSIQWRSENVGATHVARVYHSEGWTVRVLNRAHDEMVADVSLYPGLETGGLIVGSVSTLTREIFVTATLPAPSDSTRSAARFVLGIEGRAQTIRAYQDSAHGTLWCLGTWHSHLEPSGPSQMDLDTAALLDDQLRHAALLLIRHPTGYSAVVREGLVE
jgi:hypothetical protein